MSDIPDSQHNNLLNQQQHPYTTLLQNFCNELGKPAQSHSFSHFPIESSKRIEHQNGNYAVLADGLVSEAKLGELKLMASGNQWLIERHDQQGIYHGDVTADPKTGDIILIAQEGYRTIYQDDGTTIILRRDGSSTRQESNGTKIHLRPDITVSMIEHPDGVKVCFRDGVAIEIKTKSEGKYDLIDGAWFNTQGRAKVRYCGTIEVDEKGVVTIRPAAGPIDFSPHDGSQ